MTGMCSFKNCKFHTVVDLKQNSTEQKQNRTKFNVQEQGSLGRQSTIITSNAVKQTLDNLKT